MKKLFTLFAAVAAFASVNAQQLYINGDSPIGNEWGISNLKPMTLADDGYTNTVTVELEKGVYFAICTQDHAEDWNEMNYTDIRWAPSSTPSAPTKEQTNLSNGEYTLYTGFEGTMFLSIGKWTITVDARTMKMTVTSDKDTPTEDMFVVAGNSAELFGSEWNGEDNNNKMEKQTDGSYKKVYSNVNLSAGDIEYKIVKNGGTWIPDGMGNNNILSIPADDTYNVTFTIVPAEILDESVITGEATSTTGINSIEANKKVPTVFYNIAGQRVNADTKGVLITKGKKFMK